MAITPRTAGELLRELSGFDDLPGPVNEALASAGEVRKVAKATPLFRTGERAEGLYVVRTGELKIVRGEADGREQILYLARPGRSIVEGVRFDDGNYPANAIAMRAASAILIPNAAIWKLGSSHPEILKAIINLRARRTDRTLDLVSDLSLRTVPARLASFLCTLVSQRTERGEDATTLVRDLTTETVAGRLGTVREEISRGLAQLERKGALKVSPDIIEVVDRSRLEELAYGKK